MEAKILAGISVILLLIFITIIVLLTFYRNVIYEKVMGDETVNIPQITGYANKEDPYLKPSILPNLLTEKECIDIIGYASDKLSESEVVGGRHVNIRNSQQYWIPKNNPLVKPLFEKVSKMFGIPIENAEDLQVVRYLPHQYYNDHHDSCCDDNDKCRDFIKRGGQRVLTVLIYLNKDFEDGQTYFKNLDLKLRADPGSAILFYPLAQNSNKCHPDAIHAGLQVSKGIKWIANVWFRENKFT